MIASFLLVVRSTGPLRRASFFAVVLALIILWCPLAPGACAPRAGATGASLRRPTPRPAPGISAAPGHSLADGVRRLTWSAHARPRAGQTVHRLRLKKRAVCAAAGLQSFHLQVIPFWEGHQLIGRNGALVADRRDFAVSSLINRSIVPRATGPEVLATHLH